MLRELLGSKRLRLNDDQRRRLAVKARGLGGRLLADVVTNRHDRNVARLASKTDRRKVRRQGAGARTAKDNGEDRGSRGEAGSGESGLGLHADHGALENLVLNRNKTFLY